MAARLASRLASGALIQAHAWWSACGSSSTSVPPARRRLATLSVLQRSAWYESRVSVVPVCARVNAIVSVYGPDPPTVTLVVDTAVLPVNGSSTVNTIAQPVGFVL